MEAEDLFRIREISSTAEACIPIGSALPPTPGLMAFDTPTRETCTLQRQRTNTPMQALVTLNDEQFVEASRAFAQRILKSPPRSFSDRLDWAFELATGRPCRFLRKEVLKDAHSYQNKIFQKEPERAEELLKIGETPRDSCNPSSRARNLDSTRLHDLKLRRNLKQRVIKMNPFEFHQNQTRRQMIGLGARGLGALGAASLLNPALFNAAAISSIRRVCRDS